MVERVDERSFGQHPPSQCRGSISEEVRTDHLEKSAVLAPVSMDQGWSRRYLCVRLPRPNPG
jgi:hypothetical protein